MEENKFQIIKIKFKVCSFDKYDKQQNNKLKNRI